MMDIVIRISEELYETYKGRLLILGDAEMDMIAQSIANGTPLPKHHGDLIDADATFTKLNERIHAVDVMMAEHEPYSNNEIPLWMWSALIEDTTIIKADKKVNTDADNN